MSEIRRLKIPYGKKFLDVSLPSNRLLGVLESKKIPPKDARSLLRPLEVRVNRKKILVVVPDITRRAHLKEILPILLKRIRGVHRTIDIIVATGLHKRHDDRQLKDILGDGILKRYKVMNHEQNKRSLVDFGSTSDGIPVILNKNLKKYEFIISIGVLEPHLYAGYSGGAKTIAIGLAGEETINATHNVNFLDNRLTKIGSVKGNPFQDALWEIVDKVEIGFCINVINNSEGEVIKIFFGGLKKVFNRGVRFAKSLFEVETRRRADIAICGIGYPKDTNLYQASRAINYILNVDRPIVRKGGVLIVVAELKDGIGRGILEKRFYKELKDIESPREFVAKIRENGCIAGEHRAYMVAKALMDYNIIFLAIGGKRFMDGLPFPYFRDICDALRYADDIVGRNSKIYVVPYALSIIATLKEN